MNIGRRAFFLAGAGLVLAGGVVQMVVRAVMPPPHRVLTPAEKKACGPTVGATEGPYHVTGTGELLEGNLNYTGLPGLALVVSGHVYAGTGSASPLAGAEVEIWHADSDGQYHPNGNGPIERYGAGAMALRGFVRADREGVYRFVTIYPGEYTGRARHFHFKIRSPGLPELTTQLIVPARPGDRLTFDDDDIAEGLPDCQLLVIDETASPATATFDFRL